MSVLVSQAEQQLLLWMDSMRALLGAIDDALPQSALEVEGAIGEGDNQQGGALPTQGQPHMANIHATPLPSVTSIRDEPQHENSVSSTDATELQQAVQAPRTVQPTIRLGNITLTRRVPQKADQSSTMETNAPSSHVPSDSQMVRDRDPASSTGPLAGEPAAPSSLAAHQKTLKMKRPRPGDHDNDVDGDTARIGDLRREGNNTSDTNGKLDHHLDHDRELSHSDDRRCLLPETLQQRLEWEAGSEQQRLDPYLRAVKQRMGQLKQAIVLLGGGATQGGRVVDVPVAVLDRDIELLSMENTRLGDLFLQRYGEAEVLAQRVEQRIMSA